MKDELEDIEESESLPLDENQAVEEELVQEKKKLTLLEAEIQEGKQKVYSIKVDKELLFEFLMCEDDEVNDTHLAEVKKVMIIVMYKYYSGKVHLKEDLMSEALSIVMSRRKGFDPDKDAYNYLFTQIRNEIGNNIYRWAKETHAEDNLSAKEEGGYDLELLENTDVPPGVIRYQRYLTGEEDFTVKRISRTDVVDIICWLKLHERKTVRQAPTYIPCEQKSINVLYNVLKSLMEI